MSLQQLLVVHCAIIIRTGVLDLLDNLPTILLLLLLLWCVRAFQPFAAATGGSLPQAAPRAQQYVADANQLPLLSCCVAAAATGGSLPQAARSGPRSGWWWMWGLWWARPSQLSARLTVSNPSADCTLHCLV
jgi:hypothetical protein